MLCRDMRTPSPHNHPALLLCAHGSRSPEAATEFTVLMKRLQAARPKQTIAAAYLEFNRPSIPDALQALYETGHRTLHVQPLTLYNAPHTSRDMPELLADFKKKNPEVTLKYGTALGLTEEMVTVAVKAVQSVMPADTAENCKLLLVGRGSQDRSVADQSITLCRKLHERLDFGDSRYCYAAGMAPALESALRQAAQSHYPNVVVLPYLLFSGRLRQDIQDQVTRTAAKHPDFSFHMAPNLGEQDAFIDTLLAKIDTF